MTNLADVNDVDFKTEVIDENGPVLVDFGAEWCAPCRQLDPVIEELADEWEGKVKVKKLDIDTNVDTTMRYGVMGVPTLILFVDGEPKERLIGYHPKQKIIEKLTPHFSN